MAEPLGTGILQKVIAERQAVRETLIALIRKPNDSLKPGRIKTLRAQLEDLDKTIKFLQRCAR